MNIVEYQREAANAQSMASQSERDAEKSAWLCVAQGWLSLSKQGVAGFAQVNRVGRTTGITRRSKRKLKLRFRPGKGARRDKAHSGRHRKARRKTA